jgi:hypothetical protein
MSWNLIIYKPGDTPQQNQPLGDLDAVTEAFNSAFIALEWESPTEAALPVDGGFRLEFTEDDGTVRDVYTNGGFNHIKQFAALCKREGWHMADAQEGEDVDLDDPQRSMEERNG